MARIELLSIAIFGLILAISSQRGTYEICIIRILTFSLSSFESASNHKKWFAVSKLLQIDLF